MSTEARDLVAASERLGAALVDAWRRQGGSYRGAPSSHYASSIGHPCKFYHWARFKHWEVEGEFDPGIGLQGDMIQNSVITDLQSMGAEVTHIEFRFRIGVAGGYPIVGRTDCIIRIPGDPELDRPTVTEIKGLHPSYHGSVTSFESMLNATSAFWLKKYPTQAILYAVNSDVAEQFHRGGMNQETVLFISRCKSSRRTKFIIEPIEKWRYLADEAIARARSVNGSLSQDKAPEPLPYEPVWCDSCDFASVCPTMLNRKPDGTLLNVSLPVLDAKLDEVASCEKAKKTFDKRRKEIVNWLEKVGHFKTEGKVTTIVTDKWAVECQLKGGSRYWTPRPLTPSEVTEDGDAVEGE